MEPTWYSFKGATQLSLAASLAQVGWLILFTILAATVLGTAAAEAPYGDPGLLLYASSVLFAAIVVVGIGSACYIYVGFRASRSNQLHVQGLLLLLMLPEHLLWMLRPSLFWSRNYSLAFCVDAIAALLYWARRHVFIELVVLKVEAVGLQRSRWASIRFWGTWTNFLNAGGAFAGVLPTFVWRAWLIMCGGSLEDVKAITTGPTWLASFSESFPLLDQVALKAFFSVQLLLSSVCGVVMLAFLLVATRQFSAALRQMRRRRVEEEELSRVQSTLRQHLAAVLLSLPTFYVLLLMFMYTELKSTTHELAALAVMPLAHAADAAGDAVAILLLSGIGSLVLREDPLAGDIHGRIRSLLHAAVLTSRADVAFEGHVLSTPSRRCVASFPGKFTSDWHAVTWHCEAEGLLSSACVFLPRSDPRKRFGKHKLCPETPGLCWCTSLYGEVRPWGCLWFTAWMDNIERALSLGLDLVVVFFPGQAGQGVVDWQELGSSDLWNGIGLGGSQKGEVAYLRRKGISFLEEDLHDFRRGMNAGLELRL